MAVRQIPPQPVSFTPDKVTQVNFQVPCIVNNIDVGAALQLARNSITTVETRISALETRANDFERRLQRVEILTRYRETNQTITVTTSDYGIIAFSNGPTIPTRTTIIIPRNGTFAPNSVLFIKNNYASPSPAYISLDQSAGLQYLEGVTANVTLAPGNFRKMLLVRDGVWMNIL